jgi:hypothetical protein
MKDENLFDTNNKLNQLMEVERLSEQVLMVNKEVTLCINSLKIKK